MANPAVIDAYLGGSASDNDSVDSALSEEAPSGV